MKSIFRFTISILATLLLPSTASAYNFIFDGLCYNSNSDGKSATVTYQNNSEPRYTFLSGDLVIPPTVAYDGKVYTVTAIGSSAFSGCGDLTSVTIPNTVTTIGSSAFSGCSGLTSVDIPNSVKIINSSVFSECSGLTSVTIPNYVTTIDSYAFRGCSGLTSVTIPNSVTSIGSYAFSGCTSLTSVTIPNSVRKFGSASFYGCIGLTSVIWNPISCENFTSSNAYSTKLPPFYGTTGIKTFTFGNEVTSIPSYLCYGLTGLTTVNLSNSIKYIYTNAFEDCSGLTSITIPNSVTTFYDSVFKGCTNLTSINITDLRKWCAITCQSNSLPKNYSLYLNGQKVENLEVNSSINAYVFSGCTSLKSVTFGNSVNSIGLSAFDGCTGLTAVHISDLAAWCNIRFDADLETRRTEYAGYSEFGEDIYDCYTVHTEVSTNPLMYAHNLYLNGQKIEHLVIPNTVTTISKYAFSGCSSLTSLSIPSSVLSIGYGAFNGCIGLTKVDVEDIAAWCRYSFSEDGVHTITTDPEMWGDWNYYIETIKEPNTNPLKYAHNLYLNGQRVEKLVIPNTVKSIGSSAFSSCSGLTALTIPSSVWSIGTTAFVGCSGLENIYCQIENPKSISMGSNVFDGVNKSSCVLTVPTNSLEAYQTTSPWNEFSNIHNSSTVTAIYFNDTQMTLGIGQTQLLTVNVSPSDAMYTELSWTSNNPAAATVDQNGLVTATGLGIATITATITDGSGISASCTVTVTDQTDITGITLNKTTTRIPIGNSEKLTATVTPSYAIYSPLSWTSNNASVASVDQNGVVTAHGLGNAMITVSDTDGLGVSASCEVTVIQGYELSAPAICQVRGNEVAHDLAVALRNTSPVTALQFNMTLPDGFTLTTDSYGDYNVWLDDARTTSSHSVSVVPLEGNGKTYQVIISSPTNQNLNGNDGALVHFSLKGEKYPQTIGYSKMAYAHIVAADANETQYNLPDAESDLVNGYIVGDANADARVDVGDYVVTANYLLNRTGETPFYPDAANAAQGDADINVTDLVAITNIGLEIRGREIVPALPSSAASPHRLPVALAGDDIACELSVDDISGDLTTMSLAIDNDAPLAALQCDIELPGHITVANAAVTSRSARHSVAFNRLETGATRLLLSSFGTNDIAAGEGAVVTLTLRGNIQAGDLLTVGNLLMAERDLTTHGGADLTIDLGELSDIKGVATDRIAIYGRDGHIVIDSPAAGTAQLIWPNGISQELKVVAGRNTYPMATGGICIVRFGHEVKKLKF